MTRLRSSFTSSPTSSPSTSANNSDDSGGESGSEGESSDIVMSDNKKKNNLLPQCWGHRGVSAYKMT